MSSIAKMVPLTASAAGLHSELEKAQKGIRQASERLEEGLSEIGEEVMQERRLSLALGDLGAALDALAAALATSPPRTDLQAESWEWLSDNHPLLAEAVEAAVNDGAESHEIRRYVMQRTQRFELALRCEQAARYLEPAAA